MHKFHFNKIIISAIVIIVVATMAAFYPTKANACSCAPASIYFEDRVNDSIYVGVIKILEADDEQLVEENGGNYSLQNFKFEKLVSFNYSPVDSFVQKRVIDFQSRECDFLCVSRIAEHSGGDKELEIGSTYLVILNNRDNGLLLTNSTQVNRDLKLEETYLGFQEGTSVREIIDYLNQSELVDIELKETSSISEFLPYVAVVIVLVIVVSGAGAFYYLKSRKSNEE